MKLSNKIINFFKQEIHQTAKSECGIKWVLIKKNCYGNWEWMLRDGENNIGNITRYSGCDKWSILINDKGCKNKNKFIDDEETAKIITQEAASSDSKIYRRALFKAVDIGFFETMAPHSAMVEMERIKSLIKIIKTVLSEIVVNDMLDGDSGFRDIHEDHVI